MAHGLSSSSLLLNVYTLYNSHVVTHLSFYLILISTGGTGLVQWCWKLSSSFINIRSHPHPSHPDITISRWLSCLSVVHLSDYWRWWYNGISRFMAHGTSCTAHNAHAILPDPHLSSCWHWWCTLLLIAASHLGVIVFLLYIIQIC